jgi:cytidylate kinase
MSIVAISETYGSYGNEIGRELSRVLGWEFADREIIAKAAERYGEAAMELQRVTEEKPTLWERFSNSTQHYLSCVEATIFELAAQGPAILVGHGAAIMLREIPHVLRVRVTAPEPIRVVRVRDQQGLASADIARQFVRDIDHERAARMRFLYRVDVDDPLLYDLTLSSERLTVEEGARLVQQALQSHIVQPTERSLARGRDLSFAAQAKARLLVNPRTRGLKLSVSAADGKVTIAGMTDSEEARDTALQIVRDVPGLAAVTDQITVVRIPRHYGGV